MIHRSELGSALRYRWASLSSVFLIVTALTCALLGGRAVRSAQTLLPAHSTPAAQLAPALPMQAQLDPQAAAVPNTSVSEPPVVRPRPRVALRDPDQIHRLQNSLWSAMERRDAIQARLAESAVPAAPIVRQPTPIAPVSPEVRSATMRVATARSTLADLQTRYTDAYPDVVQAKDELDEAERALYAARRIAASAPGTTKPRTVAPAPLSPQLQAERESLRNELEQLSPTIADLQAQLHNAEALPRRAPAEPAPYWPLVLPTMAQQPPAAQSVPAPAPALPSSSSPTPTSVAISAAPSAASRYLRVLPQSLLLGLVASAIVFGLLESLDRTIKGPDSLRDALPAEARQISLGSMRA